MNDFGAPGRGRPAPVPAPAGPDPAELLQRCARGDDQAFATFYDLTAARVHGLVLRVVRAPELAAEVTQEVFVEVWRTAARYDPGRGSVWAWLTTMAHRRAVDRVRSVERQRDRDQRWASDVSESVGDQTEREAAASLDRERVRRGLAELSERQREALLLAYYGGYTQQQVSALLDVPLGTVKSRMRDGLRRLKDAVGGAR